MKKLIVFLAFLTGATNAYGATQGYCGPRSGQGTDENPYVFASNCRYKIENGVLTISGTGEMGGMCMNGGCMPWKDERGSVSKIVIEEGISSVGGGAFVNFTYLTDIELPKTVQSFDERAFLYSGVYSGGINHLNIPDGVQTLPRYLGGAWKKITIPDSVTNFVNDCCSFTWGSISPTDVTISAENLEKYLNAGGKFGQNLALNCTSGDCATILSDWDTEHGTTYSANARIALKQTDGSIAIFKNGKFVGYKGKRIYTLEEAEAVSKKQGNKVKIRYK